MSMPAIVHKPLPSGAARLGARTLATVYGAVTKGSGQYRQFCDGYCRAAFMAALALTLSTRPLCADRAADVLSRINYVATSLAADNAVDAMTPFDRSFANYVKLRNYFLGLTDSSQIVNEVDVVDEQDSGAESTVTVEWTLTRTNNTTLQTERRSGEIHVRLALEDGKWKIVDFSPIDFFNPQPKQQSK
jgi:hypothetical protein